MSAPAYNDDLAREAAFWSDAALRQIRIVPPDWRYLGHLYHHRIIDARDIPAVLEQICPGMSVMELGCGSGYLTLEAARRGAAALGIDIAGGAIEIARAYYRSVADDVSGHARYEVADLNKYDFGVEEHDVILAKGVLHHLPRADRVVERVHRALVPGGLFWISDTYAPVSRPTALLAGLLFMFLPTHYPHSDKIRTLLTTGIRAPSRMRASMQADGLSPFEGKGVGSNWLHVVDEIFVIERLSRHPVISGYLASQLASPDWFTSPFLAWLTKLEHRLVQSQMLNSSAVTLFARKQRHSGATP